jgi:hypothetical protein
MSHWHLANRWTLHEKKIIAEQDIWKLVGSDSRENSPLLHDRPCIWIYIQEEGNMPKCSTWVQSASYSYPFSQRVETAEIKTRKTEQSSSWWLYSCAFSGHRSMSSASTLRRVHVEAAGPTWQGWDTAGLSQLSPEGSRPCCGTQGPSSPLFSPFVACRNL